MFSAAHLTNLGSKFQSAMGLRGQGESTFGMLATGAVKDVSTLGMAYANGRFAAPGKEALELGGVPVDLLVGAGLSLGALIGFFGKFDTAADILGSGVRATYLARIGHQMGVDHRTSKLAGTPAVTKGMFGVGSPTLYPTTNAPQAVAGAWGNV